VERNPHDIIKDGYTYWIKVDTLVKFIRPKNYGAEIRVPGASTKVVPWDQLYHPKRKPSKVGDKVIVKNMPSQWIYSFREIQQLHMQEDHAVIVRNNKLSYWPISCILRYGENN